jgi:DNA-binding GntR family transcriptional regulator
MYDKSDSRGDLAGLVAGLGLETGGREPDDAAPGDENRLSDIAVRRFRKALFGGAIEPGSVLSQSDLVRMLDVPVGPLRDALRHLQAEGLLTIHPRSGIEIRKPDLELLRHSYQMRLMLERPATRLFADAVPLREIDALIRAHRAAIAIVDGREFSDDDALAAEALDRRFHARIVGALANPLADAAYGQAQDFMRLVRLDRHYRHSTTIAIRTFNEHLAILEAMRRRDAGAAEAALEAHFARAMQRAMGIV